MWVWKVGDDATQGNWVFITPILCWALGVQQSIVAAELSTQHLQGCVQHKPCTVLVPPESPCNPRIRALQTPGSPSSLSLLSPLRLPPALPWCSTQVLPCDKGKASPGLHFHVLCWVFNGWVSDEMKTRVPAGRATAGECDTTVKLPFSKVHTCPVHFPGHACIFAALCVCCDLHKRNSSLNKSSKTAWWQLEVSFLWIASLGISW